MGLYLALTPKYQIIELPIDAGACRENFHVNQWK
jgi:hypothetical protein